MILAAGTARSDLLALRSEGDQQLPADGPGPWTIEPVLGQALELELSCQRGWNWPGVVVTLLAGGDPVDRNQEDSTPLETVAPGLLLVSGHYRDGVLLAPASAEWMVDQVEGRPGSN